MEGAGAAGSFARIQAKTPSVAPTVEVVATRSKRAMSLWHGLDVDQRVPDQVRRRVRTLAIDLGCL